MEIGYGILLEDKAFNYIRGLELELFENLGLEAGLRQPPHITIKPPFEVSELQPHFEYLERLARETEPFEISLKGFNSFGEKVLYLDVLQNEKLFDLNKKITSDLSTNVDEMILHATLAYNDLNQESFKKAYSILMQKTLPDFKFVFKKIGLFYRLSNDAGWIIIKKANLNQTI